MSQFSEAANPYAAPSTPHSPQFPPQQDLADSAAMRMILPVGRSIYAIVAGYLGLLSLAACFLGPFAILFGILGILDIRKNPKKSGMVRCIVGIVLGLIGCMLLIGSVVAMIAGAANGPR